MNTYNPKDCDKECSGFKRDCPQYNPLSADKNICDIAYMRTMHLYEAHARNKRMYGDDLKGLDKILENNK